MINKGNYVKCFLTNAALVEGVVEEYSNNLVKLLCDDKSYIIVNNPQQNIIFTKVSILEPKQDSAKEIEKLNDEFNLELSRVPANEEEQDIKNMKLAQLKILLNKKEKEIIVNKLKQHSPGEIKGVKYEQPRFKK